MAFQIKDFVSIVSSIVNHMRGTQKKITDFQPGSVARTLVEAPAVEIEELYLQMFNGLREAIPVATFQSFRFNLLPAATAHGFVSVSRADPAAEDAVVPVGTEFSTPSGKTYTSTAAVTWAAAELSVRVPVAAVAPGLAGNAGAGEIDRSPLFGAGYTISNAEISTGRDAETDSEREQRFAEFVASLSRGTKVAVLYAAKQAVVLDDDGNRYEYVVRTGVQELPGSVSVFLYGSRGTPSSELIDDAQKLIDGYRDEATGEIVEGYRPAGVRVQALPMVERSVAFSISVVLLPGYVLDETMQQALAVEYDTAIRSIQPDTTLYVGNLLEALLVVPGVRSIIPRTTENIVCGANEALVPGALTVSTA